MAGYIGNKSSVVSSGAERKFKFAITETTTTLSNLAYTRDLVHVFHNGVRLVDGTDYTATNGTSITLTNAAEDGDEVVVISYASFQPSDTVSASTGGVFEGNITVNADLTVSGNTDITGGTIDGTVIGGSTPAAISGTTGTFSGNLTVDTNTLFVDASTNRVAVGTSDTSQAHFTVRGPGTASATSLFITNIDGTYNPYIIISHDLNGVKITQNSSSGGSASHLSFDTGGVAALSLKPSENVFNEGGTANMDFRVESDTNTHAFFVDAGAENVRVGTASFGTRLVISGTNAAVGATVGGSNTGLLFLYDTSAAANAGPEILMGSSYDGTNSIVGASIKSYKVPGVGSNADQYEHGLIFKTSDYPSGLVERLRVSEHGLLTHQRDAVFNESGGDYDFRVESDANTHALFVNAGSSVLSHIGLGNTAGTQWTSTFDQVIQLGNYGRGFIANYDKNNANYQTVIGTGLYYNGGYASMHTDTGYSMANFYNGGVTLYTGAATANVGDQVTMIDRFNVKVNGETIVNEDSGNFDFRVESDTNTHALFVDASTSNVGINNSGPTSSLNIGGNKSFVWNNTGIENVATLLVGNRTTVDSQNAFAVAGTTHNTYYPAAFVIDSQYDAFGTNFTNFDLTAYGVNYAGWNGSMRLRVSQNAGIHEAIRMTPTETAFNELSNDTDFRVESDTNTHALFVDASENRVFAGGLSSGSVGSAQFIVNSGSIGTSAGDTLRLQQWYYDTGNGSFFGHKARRTDANGVWTGVVVDTVLEVDNSADLYNYITYGIGSLSFNDSSNDIDFRVESNNNANMLVVEAANDAVLVGKSTPSIAANGFTMSLGGCTYSASSGNTYHVYDNGASAYRFYVSYAGTVNYTALNQLSDEREKTNIADLPVGLDAIKALRPRQFDWINDNQDNDVFGFIAQEVEQVLPTLVSDYMKSETETRKGIKHIELIPVLVKAMQEQQALIETLEARIAALDTQ